MSEKQNCKKCNGMRFIKVLVNAHDDKTEIIECPECYGKGHIHQMSQEETDDYFRDSCGSDGWS